MSGRVLPVLLALSILIPARVLAAEADALRPAGQGAPLPAAVPAPTPAPVPAPPPVSASAPAGAPVPNGAAAPAAPLPAAPRGQGPQLRAQLRAVRSTVLCSDMAGRIIDLKIKEGDRFAAGQPLVRFLCSSQENALAKARAVEDKRFKLHEINKNLLPLKSVSNLEVEVSMAELAEAQAEVRQARTMIERCQVRAPFAGRVAEVLARQDQFIAEGQPLLEILSEDELELEFLAPSVWLKWLKPGQEFAVAIDELGESFPGKVTRLSARLDPVSQSIKVFGRVEDHARRLLPGMSGRIDMKPQ